METLLLILIILCMIIVLLLVFLLFKMNNKKDMEHLENTLNVNTQNTIENKALSSSIQKSFEIILKETMKTKESLSINDSKMDKLNDYIEQMNNIMVNTKRRGNFGEYQLNHLLSIYSGQSQEVFETQYSLDTGTIGDAALHIPGSDKVLIIDSKFPLENYQRILDDQDTPYLLEKDISLFKQNVKKHIKDIGTKYITNQTVEQAIMFIPSEAIYQYICEAHTDLIDEAHKQHVLMTSPTTLIGVVFTLVNITKDFKRNQHLKQLEKTIIVLKEDSDRLIQRYDKVMNTYGTLYNQLGDLEKSVNKVSNKINKVYDGYDEED